MGVRVDVLARSRNERALRFPADVGDSQNDICGLAQIADAIPIYPVGQWQASPLQFVPSRCWVCLHTVIIERQFLGKISRKLEVTTKVYFPETGDP